MEIFIYCNRSPKNTLTKSITLYKKVKVHLKEEYTDILTPIFVIAEKNVDTLISSTNYVLSEDFGRYYFAKPVLVTGGTIELHCQVDPLMSMKNYILNTKATLKRQEFIHTPYIIDGKLPISKQLQITTYNFSSSPFVELTDELLHCITLTTTGGK